MKEVNMQSQVRVDPRSEMLALTTGGDTKNILLNALEVEGPLDTAAISQAIIEASKELPQVTSCIKEVKVRGRYHLVWEQRPDRRLAVSESELPDDGNSGPSFDRLMKHLQPWLDETWDLFEEPPARFHIVRIAEDRHVLASAFHHVASDAGTASEFGRRFLANYHQIITGRKPAWAEEAHAISSSSKRRVRVRKESWRESLAGARQTLDNLFFKPMLPAGSGSVDDSEQHHVKRVLSTEVTENIGKSSVKNGVSFVDLLTACTNIAVDQWNAARAIEPGILTTSMTVNTRGRFRGYDQPNNSSVIFFRSPPGERRDARKFSRSLAMTRIKHFRKQMDLKYMQEVERMMNSLRLLPFNMRRRLVQRVVNRHQFSMSVTVLGVVWPKMKNNKPTADTVVTECGNLSIKEVHGIGYKLLSSTRLLLIVYAYKNQMNLILASHACLFTREEAEDFLDLIIKNLLERVEPSASQVDAS
jgi:hypothetical protein